MHIIIKNNYLLFNDYRIKCALGKRGIGNKKKEGDFITPRGIFKIKFILYRKDRIKNLNTILKKIKIKKKMGWCDDVSSDEYNKLITLPSKYKYEKLFRKDNVYDIILVLDYNMRPIRKFKGSAIFIHIAKQKFTKTEGCIAIKKNELKKIVKKINHNTRIKIS
jgi:L,D-peptidoglycan transpeptidase YkuD (ErfK/YbiS/YcfS/YnhG family)